MRLRSLRYLTDENVSPRVVSFLREKGNDVSDVKEQKWIGREDRFLMAKAYDEKRFILTHDSDFGTLAIAEGIPCYGIIYLRLKDLKVNHIISVLDKFLKVDEEISEGMLIVVDDKRLRIRRIGQT